MSHSRAAMAHRLRRRASLALEFKVLSRRIASKQSMTGWRRERRALRRGSPIDAPIAPPRLLAPWGGASGMDSTKMQRALAVAPGRRVAQSPSKEGVLPDALLPPAMRPSRPANGCDGGLRPSKISSRSVKRSSVKATARLCKGRAPTPVKEFVQSGRLCYIFQWIASVYTVSFDGYSACSCSRVLNQRPPSPWRRRHEV